MFIDELSWQAVARRIAERDPVNVIRFKAFFGLVLGGYIWHKATLSQLSMMFTKNEEAV
jgi:hypothetical protein